MLQPLLKTLFSVCTVTTALSAAAITPPELAQLRNGSSVQMPLTDAELARIQHWSLDTVGVFTDSRGRQWYRLESHLRTGETTIALIDAAPSDSNAEVVLQRLTLDQLRIEPRFLQRISKQGQGELTLDGKHYTYREDSSDRATFTDTADADNSKSVSYYWFRCKEGSGQSLLLLDWGDSNIEAFQTESIKAERIVVRR